MYCFLQNQRHSKYSGVQARDSRGVLGYSLGCQAGVVGSNLVLLAFIYILALKYALNLAVRMSSKRRILGARYLV